MATEVGGNLIKDSVVFGYDTNHGVADNDTSTRFYPGESTDNVLRLFTNNTLSNPSSIYRVTVTEQNTVDVTAPNGQYSRYTGIDSSSNNQVYYNYSGNSNNYTGSTITFSAYLKGSGTCHLTTYDNQSGYGTSGTITLTNKWVRYSYTRAVNGSATSHWSGVRGILNTTDVYVAACQSEIKGHATPFTATSRSDTQSLIDVKESKLIDISNTTFDSNAQMGFDGSNDMITVDVDALVRASESVSVEGIVKATSINSGGPWGIMTDHANTTDKDGFWWHMNIGGYVYFRVEDATAGEQGTTFGGSVPFTANVYEHIVTVVGTSKVLIYVNGELSKSYTPNFRWNRIDSNQTAYLSIGRTYPNYYLPCEIPVFKLHNRQLTAAEVKEKYESYKNRFNL